MMVYYLTYKWVLENQHEKPILALLAYILLLADVARAEYTS